jgi:hypothetical protein
MQPRKTELQGNSFLGMLKGDISDVSWELVSRVHLIYQGVPKNKFFYTRVGRLRLIVTDHRVKHLAQAPRRGDFLFPVVSEYVYKVYKS